MPAVQLPLCGLYWKIMGQKDEMLKTIPPIPLRYIEIKDSLNPTASTRTEANDFSCCKLGTNQ